MNNPFKWTLEKVKRLNHIIWNTPLSEISKGKTFVYRQLSTIVLAVRGFVKDRVSLRASALTIYTLLAIVPLAAIAFAIAKGFGLDRTLEEVIVNELQSQQEVLNWLLTNARNALEETRGGYIAGVGIIILFWSVMSLLDDIENSFNHIWQIRSPRPFFRKFTDYLTIMLIAPIFIILSSSITVFINTELTSFMEKAPILDFFKPLINFLFKLAPYFLTWIILTILLIIMPNTKVKFKPALIAGVIAGTILQILQWLYIDLQFGITKLNAIYGSFAAVPLFILWVQSSWTVVLLGAELSYAYQNVSQYERDSETFQLGNYEKKAIVLLIMKVIIHNFSLGKKPASAPEIASAIKIPVRPVTEILQDLSGVNLVSVITEDDERLYQPALDINKISVDLVFSRLDEKSVRQVLINKERDYDKVLSIMEKIDMVIAGSDANILVRDL
jgi:membrane protein